MRRTGSVEEKLRKETRVGSSKALDLSDQRKMAKAGMAGSLGALFATGFFRFKGARMLHPWFGWALLGFSIWHHLVSKPSAK
jgi:hypothetical protein